MGRELTQGVIRSWASLATLLLVLSFGLHASAKSPSQRARAAFSEGKAQFLAGLYDAAIASFERAYALKPHYRVQCNIARCYELKGDMKLAASRYQRCLDEGGDGVSTAISKEISDALTRVRAKIPPEPPPPEPKPPKLEVPEPPPEPLPEPPLVVRRGPGQHWFWIATAVAVGLGAATAVVGYKTLSCKDDYEAAPTKELYDACWRYRLMSNLFAAGTAVAGGASITLYVLTDFSSEEEEDQLSFGINYRGTF